MEIDKYNKYIHRGRIIFISGIFMMFETVEYSKYVGLIMIILGISIVYYCKKQINYKNKIDKIISDFNEKIIKFFEENEYKEKQVEKPKEIKMSVIKTFEKKYKNNNNIIININNIDNFINNTNINENKITLFLDLYMFVSNMKNILELCYIKPKNDLLIDYYKYYYNIIAYISNLHDEVEISIALSYLIDDYNNNTKNLNHIFKINSNNVIKHILKELNNVIDNNVIIKFNRFIEYYNKN